LAAIAGQVLYAAGLVATLGLVLWATLALWPLAPSIEQELVGINPRVQLALLIGAGLSVAWLFRWAGDYPFARRLHYVGAGLAGILCWLSTYGSDEAGLISLGRAALAAGIAFGALTLGTQLAFWLAYLLFVLPTLPPGERSRGGTAWQVVYRASRLDQESAGIVVGVAATAIVVVIKLLAMAVHWLSDHGVNWSAVGNAIVVVFGSAVLLLFLCYAAAAALGALRRAAKAGWRPAWPSAGLAERWSAADLGRALGRMTWRQARALVKSVASGCAGLLGCFALLMAVVIPFVLLIQGLDALGIDEHQRSHLPALLVLLSVIGIVLLVVQLLLLRASRWGREHLPAWLRRPRGWGLAAAEWARRVQEAPAEVQAVLLRDASPHAFGMEAPEFLAILEPLEPHVMQEPAASRYWKLRHDVEEIIRQERLSNLALGEPAGSATAGTAGPRPPDTGGPRRSSGPAAPGPTPAPAARRRGGIVRWVGGALFLLAAAGVLLNAYIERHRVVYVVNGLPQPVSVRIDDGPPFEVAARSALSRTLAEGEHAVSFQRPGGTELRQDFTLRSACFRRFLDNSGSANVVNLGGAAVLRYVAAYVPAAQDVRATGVIFYVGTVFETVRGVDHVFEPDTKRGNALEIAPDMPAWCFWQLPTLFTEDERLGEAERALVNAPDNGELLDAYVQACINAEVSRRARDFIARTLQQVPAADPWLIHWQDLTSQLDGPEGARKHYEQLAAQAPDSARALFLAGRMQPTLSKQLEYYDRAPKLDGEYLAARRARAAALDRQGLNAAATEECLRGLAQAPDDGELQVRLFGLYLAGGADGLAWAQQMLDDLRARHRDPDWGYHWAVALDVLNGQPDQARERFQRLDASWEATQREEPFVTWPARVRASIADTLDDLLHDHEAALAAADGIPDPANRARVKAFALLGLGRIREAVAIYQSGYPEWRGYFLLLASVLSGSNATQSNEFRDAAVREWQQSKLTGFRTAAAWLAGPKPPAVAEVADLSLDLDEKALLWLALGQRHAALCKPGFAAAGQLARGPFRPWGLLRRAMEAGR
jgi:hypothetical protein